MCNARMESRELKQYCALDDSAMELLKFAIGDLNLSARAYDRVLKVARTFAGLAGTETILSDHSVARRLSDRQKRMWIATVLVAGHERMQACLWVHCGTAGSCIRHRKKSLHDASARCAQAYSFPNTRSTRKSIRECL